MNQDTSFPFHTSITIPPFPAQGPPVSTGGGALLTPATAFALAAADAEKGNPNAMMGLANFYERGLGVARNFAKALEWYEKAAAAGIPEGNFALGICYEVGVGNPGDMEKAMAAFERAAEKGMAPAMHKLASLYISGERIPQDTEKGFSWLHRAAEAGLPDAHNIMGVILLRGLLGHEIDEKKAMDSFKKAAEGGHLGAIRNISIICFNGIDGRKSLDKALKWYLIALKGGYYMDDIKPAMEEVKKELRPEQVNAAEEQAEQWLKDIREKNQTVIGRQEPAPRA